MIHDNVEILLHIIKEKQLMPKLLEFLPSFDKLEKCLLIPKTMHS